MRRLLILALAVTLPLFFAACRTVVKPSKAATSKLLEDRHGVPVEILQLGSNYPNSGHKGLAKAGTPAVEFGFVVSDGRILTSGYQGAVWRRQATELHGASIQAKYGADAVMRAAISPQQNIPSAGFPSYKQLLQTQPGDLKLVTRIHLFREPVAGNLNPALAGLADYMNEVREMQLGEHLVFVSIYDEAFFRGKDLSGQDFGFNTTSTKNFEGTLGRGRKRGTTYLATSPASPPVTAEAIFGAIRTDGIMSKRTSL